MQDLGYGLPRIAQQAKFAESSETSVHAKFAFWAFCELPLYGFLRSSP